MSRHLDYDSSCTDNYFSSIKSSYTKMTPHFRGVIFNGFIFFVLKSYPLPIRMFSRPSDLR